MKSKNCRSLIAKMAFTVLLGGFYPLFVFSAGQVFEPDGNLLMDRPLESRYGNKISSHAKAADL